MPKRNPPPQITVAGLREFRSTEEVLYARSSYENKSLYARLDGTYRVVVGSNTIIECRGVTTAVDAYNSITEKFLAPTSHFKL